MRYIPNHVADVRNYPSLGTYVFHYNTDAVPHLTDIFDAGGGGAGSYTFQVTNGQLLKSPFSGALFATTSWLQGVTQTNTGRQTSFLYDGTGAPNW